MKDNEAYIRELFRFVKTDSLLCIDKTGRIRRVFCPFKVIPMFDIPPLREGEIYFVDAVKMTSDRIDVFVIDGRGFYIGHFWIWI
jgi:hypothetical protein